MKEKAAIFYTVVIIGLEAILQSFTQKIHSPTHEPEKESNEENKKSQYGYHCVTRYPAIAVKVKVGNS